MLSILLKQLDSVFTSSSKNWEIREKVSASRNEKIVEHLYKKHADDIFHFALTLADYATAQDISHKLWLKLLEHPEKFKHQQNFKAYMFSSVRNMILDEYKRTNRLTSLASENDMDWCKEYAENGEKHTMISIDNTVTISEAFNNALEILPFYQREAFCLQQEGFTIEDIADITQTPKETIKTRLRYAKQKLKQLLESHHVDK